ncbi:hypothetical protein EKO04_004928 [Ascochyta lentis]|uniref:F-box domain-containing protein n=1 Tax=Ascochyta lentis TaxID=205686 RepID=A0A8H7J895_9PLEO|nr:hypothetical protein EKO04_004928 [Ascochyta lentis]
MVATDFASIQTTTSIVDLSTEILCLIIDQLPLTSHFDFAYTCTRLAAASEYVLRRHQEAYVKFRVASDLDPTTVPLLLRSAFGRDPIPAWHVRSFEVWRDRTTWAEWTTYSLSASLISTSHPSCSDLQIPFRSLGEVEKYLDWYDEYAHKEINKEKALSQVEAGHDGVLKAVLFARCPRLQGLKFVTRSQRTGSTLSWLRSLISVSNGVQVERSGGERPHSRDDTAEEDGDMARSRDNYNRLLQEDPPSENESESDREWEVAYAKWMEEQVLSEMKRMEIVEQDVAPDRTYNEEIGSLEDCSSGVVVDLEQWPVGFARLRSVAVGVFSDTWMDDREYPSSTSLVARLLRLPNIDTLYFNGLRCDDEDDLEDDDGENNDNSSDTSELANYNLPARCSSVKNLFFEGLGLGLDGSFRELLCEAPRKLRTAAFRNSGPEGELWGASYIFRDLIRFQGSSLQSLMWYGYDSNSIQGDGCLMDHTERLDGLHTLKQLSFNVQDIAMSAYHSRWKDGSARDEEDNELYVRYAAAMFPENLECLVLWEDAGSGEIGDIEGETELLERAIIDMIKDGRYKNLRAIFLEDVQRATARETGVIGVDFERAIEAGRAAGVDVHTLTNRPTQHAVSFPERVDQFDLKTGKYPGGRPSDWVFNSYTGCREPPRRSMCYSYQP